jgi:hypothetical protein
MAIRIGQDTRGRFVKGHKLAKGRPFGSRNKPIVPPPAPIIRRFHDILTGITSDLGGRSELSTGEFQLARRAAYISIHCEQMEQIAAPSAAELALYGTLTSHLGKTLRLLGLKRQPRDVTPIPSLSEYLNAQRSDVAEQDDLAP